MSLTMMLSVLKHILLVFGNGMLIVAWGTICCILLTTMGSNPRTIVSSCKHISNTVLGMMYTVRVIYVITSVLGTGQYFVQYQLSFLLQSIIVTRFVNQIILNHDPCESRSNFMNQSWMIWSIQTIKTERSYTSIPWSNYHISPGTFFSKWRSAGSNKWTAVWGTDSVKTHSHKNFTAFQTKWIQPGCWYHLTIYYKRSIGFAPAKPNQRTYYTRLSDWSLHTIGNTVVLQLQANKTNEANGDWKPRRLCLKEVS